MTRKFNLSEQYKTRVEIDKVFMPAAWRKFYGMTDENIQFIEKVQLKDRELWKKLVSFFGTDIDDDDKGWRCEYWGKIMRGGAWVYSYTRDNELYAVLEETVRELLTRQDEQGRFSTYSIENEFDGWDMWGRKYVMLGLLHFYDICFDEELKSEIVESLKAHADYIEDNCTTSVQLTTQVEARSKEVDAVVIYSHVMNMDIIREYVEELRVYTEHLRVVLILNGARTSFLRSQINEYWDMKLDLIFDDDGFDSDELVEILRKGKLSNKDFKEKRRGSGFVGDIDDIPIPEEYMEPPKEERRLFKFSEISIAMLYNRDWGTKEIAVHLNISESSVKNHIKHIYQKLCINKKIDLQNYLKR